MPRLRAALALALILPIIGCASRLKAPIMQVEKLAVKSMRITGAGLEVTFKMRNPNQEDLNIERFEYELALNGHRLGRGFHPTAFTVKGFDEATVMTKFDLNFLSLPGTVKTLLEGGDAEAEAKGTFYLDGVLGSRPLHFKSKGTVPLSQSSSKP